MLKALISAICKKYYIDSSYKAKSWNIAFIYIQEVTTFFITIKYIKSKYNYHKKD